MSREAQATSFDIALLLPMLPWEGPPLPRFLGIYWPWLQGPMAAAPLKVEHFFRGSFDFSSGTEVTPPKEEEVELVRDASGAITRMVKRRRP